MDGGVGSNMPSGIVMKPLQDAVAAAAGKLKTAQASGNVEDIAAAKVELEVATSKLEQTSARTLLVTFDESGEAYKTMHEPWKRDTSNVFGRLAGRVAGDVKFKDNQRDDTQRIRDAGLNVMVVHHGNIDTLNLNAGPERVKAANLESRMRTLEQIVQRQHQRMNETFSSANSVVATLSPAEKRDFVNAGPPDRALYEAPGRSAENVNQLHRAAMDIFFKARADLGIA